MSTMTETVSVTQRFDGSFRAVHRQYGWTVTGETRAEALVLMAELLKAFEFGDDEGFETVDGSAYSITTALFEDSNDAGLE